MIERPYFGAFMYKILFRGPDLHDHASLKRKWVPSLMPRSQIFELQKYRRLHGLIRDRARELSSSKDFRFRQDEGLSVYMHDHQSVLTLANEYRDHVIGIWGPLDETHHQHALESPKILVKQRLWKGRYRYRAILRIGGQADENSAKALSNLLEPLVLGEDYDVNRSLEDYLMIGQASPIYAWQSGEKMLYCNDEGLIMMISLSFTDAIHKIDKVITHDELSQQEKIASKDAGTKPGQSA